jgi:hypothetical protein
MPFPFNFFRKNKKGNLNPKIEPTPTPDMTQPFQNPEPTAPPIQVPLTSDYYAWLNELSYIMAWLTEKSNQWIDYLYPESWKTLKDYTKEELEILKRQQLDKQARVELRSALLDRKTRIRTMYKQDLAHLSRKKKLFSNWFEANQDYLQAKKAADESFNPAPGSKFKEIPGWEPERADLNKMNSELCYTFQCSESTPMSFTSDSSQSFEHQMKLRELHNQNFEIQQKLAQIQGEYQKCVDYVNQNEPLVQSRIQPQSRRLEIGSGEPMVQIQPEKPVPNPSIPLSTPIPLNTPQQPTLIAANVFLDQETTFFEGLLHCLFIPIRIVTGEITFGTKYIRGSLQRFIIVPTIRLILACLLLFCYYQIIMFASTVISSLLESALSYLPKRQAPPIPIEAPKPTSKTKTKAKSKNQKSKSKKQFKEEEDEDELNEMEESQEFWDKHLGRFSRAIRILRGGSLIPIREANIYTFSELDRQHALLYVSPIPSYIQLERQRIELERLIVESKQISIDQNPLRLKKVKEFTTKFKKVSSQFKKWILLPTPRLSYKARVILFGTVILLGGNTGTPISTRTRNLPNKEIVLSSQQLGDLMTPIVEDSIAETSLSLKDLQKIESIPTSVNEPVRTSSRLKSPSQIRKKAKLVRLSDLPPLPNQDFELEIESTPISRSTDIKLNLN